jgi:hypothetical protein
MYVKFHSIQLLGRYQLTSKKLTMSFIEYKKGHKFGNKQIIAVL